MSQNNFLETFGSSLQAAKKADEARHFLVQVERVAVDPKSKERFKLLGRRLDTGQQVFLVSKKASAGQRLPEEGGVIRADKASAHAAKSERYPDVPIYNAEYFHAYSAGDLCMQAIVRPSPVRTIPNSTMITAEVTAVDTEVNVTAISMADAAARIDDYLVMLLQPWAFRNKSSITHDAQGTPVWSADGTTKGAVPKVILRVPGMETSRWVSGIGAVALQDGTSRRPNPEEIRAYIQKNTSLSQFKQALAAVATNHPEDLGKYKVVLIPATAFSVGRDSLANESYLQIRDAFDYKTAAPGGAAGGQPPAVTRGFKGAWVHVQMSPNGRLIVTDVRPNNLFGGLTKSIPETRPEVELRQAAEKALQAQQQLSAPARPSPAPAAEPNAAQRTPVAPEGQKPRTAQAQKPAASAQSPARTSDQALATRPAGTAESQAEPDDAESWDDLAFMGEDLSHDLKAIEMMSREPEVVTDDEMEELLAEVDARASRRGMLPRMGG